MTRIEGESVAGEQNPRTRSLEAGGNVSSERGIFDVCTSVADVSRHGTVLRLVFASVRDASSLRRKPAATAARAREKRAHAFP